MPPATKPSFTPICSKRSWAITPPTAQTPMQPERIRVFHQCAWSFILVGYACPSSNPTSVTVPVKCVVRMKPVIVVSSPFCMPEKYAARYGAMSSVLCHGS